MNLLYSYYINIVFDLHLYVIELATSCIDTSKS